MALQNAQPGDNRVSLTVSQDEAERGSTRTITLPNGHTMTVTIPAGIHHGEEIRLLGQGASTSDEKMASDPVLHISIGASPDAPVSTAYPLPNRPSEQVLFSSISSESPVESSPSEQVLFSSISSEFPVESSLFEFPQTTLASGMAGSLASPVQQASASHLLAQSGLPPQQPQRKGLDTPTRLVISLVIVIVLVVSSLLAYDLAYYLPNQAHLAGTATVNAQATGTVSSSQTQIANSEATGAAQEQATAQVYQNIYAQATSGVPVLNDALHHQSNLQWEEYNSSGDFCGFKNNFYHVTENDPGYFQPCFNRGQEFADFAFQIDMTILKGDFGGVLFRVQGGTYYFFEISEGGAYSFYLYNSNQSDTAQLLKTGNTDSVRGYPGSLNELTLIAEGPAFYIYVNQHFVDSTTDPTFGSGQIGLMCDSSDSATDVAFSNAKAWVI